MLEEHSGRLPWVLSDMNSVTILQKMGKPLKRINRRVRFLENGADCYWRAIAFVESQALDDNIVETSDTLATPTQEP